MPDDKMLDRIRALLAKAEGTNFEAEAEAYTAKAQELMAKYAISEAQLRHKGKTGDVMIARITIKRSVGANWRRVLLESVAASVRCRSVEVTGRGGGFCLVVGFESDLSLVRLLFTSIDLQMVTACNRAMAARNPYLSSHGSTFRATFYAGYVTRVIARLAEARQDAEREAEEQEPGTALALIDTAKRVDEEFERKFPKTTSRALTSPDDPHAYLAGHAEGGRADLSHPGQQLATAQEELTA